MNQTKIIEIDIADTISSNLFVRASAVDLFEKIEKMPESDIVIDFENVTFLNRSFAHEYLTQKSKSSKNIYEKHLAKDVKYMIDVVFKVHRNEFSKLNRQNSEAVL